MKKFNILLVVMMICCIGVSQAQAQVLNIWPGSIPGSISSSTYKEVSDSDKNWSWTVLVTNPTISFYPAPEALANGTAVIICPGGGYERLANKHEGSQIAEWLNKMGITAFVLKYRLPSDVIMSNKTIGPLQDAQEALRLVRRHAVEWKINPDKIGIMGFSAGGHLAATLSTHFSDNTYKTADSTSARPNFSLLIYPVVSMDSTITHMGSRNNLLGKKPVPELVKFFSNELQVSKNTPPAFLVHSLNDNVVPVVNSINYALALKNLNIPCELHIYQRGGHGYGLGRGNDTESSWPEACKKWLKMNGFTN